LIHMTEVATKRIDSGSGLETLVSRFDESGESLVARAWSVALKQSGDRPHSSGERMIDHARGVAHIVTNLRLDAESVAAAFFLAAKSRLISQRGSRPK
jgi:(p)ppGpp synthase/HD superfamily hydrolase